MPVRSNVRPRTSCSAKALDYGKQGLPVEGLGHKGRGPVLDGPMIRSQQFATFQDDAPACDNCGAITVRNGNCYLCHNCGNSMGCS